MKVRGWKLLIWGTVVFVFLFGLEKLGDFKVEEQQAQPEELIKIQKIEIFTDILKKNQSLYLSLLQKNLPSSIIYQLTQVLSQVFNLKSSLPGDFYTLLLGEQDSIISFEYHTNREKNGALERYILEHQDGTLKAFSLPLKLTKVIKGIKGKIQSSLWESMIGKCEEPELILKLTDIFAWEIDFLTEPKLGDTYTLIFEEYQKDGKFVKYGDILSACFRQKDGSYQAILYEDPTGYRDYYDLLGRSLKKELLKSPLHFRRISSGFSYSRFHPIYKIFRPHLGVDYAAPLGTPVVAAGDGIVTFLGWKKGFGRYVEIKHRNGWFTCYGHLSKFGSGIRNGKKVNQNDVIGYVGSSGASTGPHLDYRCRVNGRYVNPLKMTPPRACPVKKEYLAEFEKHKQSLLQTQEILTEDDIVIGGM